MKTLKNFLETNANPVSNFDGRLDINEMIKVRGGDDKDNNGIDDTHPDNDLWPPETKDEEK